MEDWTKHSFKVITKHFEGNDDITVLPISDVHFGTVECHMKEWFSFCDWVVTQSNTYLLLLGDLLDNATKTSIGNGFEAVIRPREAKKKMVECLTPIKDKILIGTGGNHEGRTERDCDQDLTRDIFSKLDIEDIYTENLGFIKIRIGKKNGNGMKNPTYTFCVAHGDGNSIYVGSSAIKAERFGQSIDNIDALFVGHTHKPLNYPVGKLHVDTHNNQVTIKPWWLVVSSSWLGYASYAAKKLLSPTANMKQWVTLSGQKKEMIVHGSLM